MNSENPEATEVPFSMPLLYDLFVKIYEYDDSLTPTALSQNIGQAVDQLFGKKDFDIVELFQKKPAERRGNLVEQFQREMGPILDKLGLYAEAVDTYRKSISEDPKTDLGITGARILLGLKDANKLISYLSYLTELDSVSEYERRALSGLIDSFIELIGHHYNSSNPQVDSYIEFFANLDQLLEAFKGLDKQFGEFEWLINRLDGYYQATKQRCVCEWDIILDKGFLSKTEYFGPACWHTDMCWDTYEEKWRVALVVLHKLKANPHASAMFNRVKNYLVDALAEAIADMETDEHGCGYAKWKHPGIAKKALAQISKI